MRTSETIEKIETIYKRFCARLRISNLGRKSKQSGQENPRITFRSLHSVAFQLIGERTKSILSLFEGLDSSLEHSGLKINFNAYVSLTVLGAALISVCALAFIPFSLVAAFRLPFLPAVLFGIGGSLFAFAFSTIGFCLYPIYVADKLKRALDDELPFTTGYMAILTGAGVSPEKVLYSLSNLNVQLVISEEAKDIMRDVNLFGRDIISALEEESRRTSSERFREMIEGLISTIHSGGNLATYLREKSKQYMRLKRISLSKFSDTLSILSEFYVAMLITGPLLLVIMLAVMAMLGGGTLGMLSPDFILNLLTYVGIPFGSIMFLIILDAVSPKW